MSAVTQRIRASLKAGKEIEVIAQGGDRAMTAFEHPYLSSYIPSQLTTVTGLNSEQRDIKKAWCYWYMGDKRQSAVFNLENLTPLY